MTPFELANVTVYTHCLRTENLRDLDRITSVKDVLCLFRRHVADNTIRYGSKLRITFTSMDGEILSTDQILYFIYYKNLFYIRMPNFDFFSLGRYNLTVYYGLP